MLTGILIIGGLVVAIIAISHFWRRHQEKVAASWASSEGQIVTSQVTDSLEQDSDGDMQRVFRPQVVYRFQAGDQPMTGDRIDFGSHSYNSPAKAQAICDKYPAGSTVTVYYDPAKPKHSVLDRGKA